MGTPDWKWKVRAMGENRDNMRQAMKELLGLVGFGPEEGSSKPEQAEQVRPAASAPEATTATRTATVERPVVVEQPKAEKTPEQPKTVEKPAVAGATDLEATQKKVATTVERSFFGFGKEKEKEKTPEFGEVEIEHIPETEPYFAGWEAAEPQKPPFIRPGATVIAAGATFFGDIRAEGDVEVLGKLKGNLEATGNIRVIGKVLGDVKGESVILEGCTVQGNITSTAGVLLDESAMVIGDVLASDLETKGKIKGNLQIARAANFGTTALLAGNVIAATIIMAQGARVQGAVRIAEDPETNGLFGELEI